MEIIRYYKNYEDLKKDMYEKVGICSNKNIKVRFYTSIEDIVATDLEIEIYSKNGTFLDSTTVASVETIDDDNWDKTMDKHRQLLLTEKLKIINYLSEKFPNVLAGEDYIM